MKDVQAEGETGASGGDEWASFADKDLSFADAEPARQICRAAAVMVAGTLLLGLLRAVDVRTRVGMEADLLGPIGAPGRQIGFS